MTLPAIDWSAALEETSAHLARMIQIDTTNPPGGELPLALYVESVLSAEGIETHVLQPAAGRGATIARIRGTGRAQPILITAHLDVVSVQRDSWSVDPFGGVVRDGYVYGRGAIDDKGMLATELMAMLLLKRHVVDRGGVLDRDVIFAATADEETGGLYGLGWIIEHHPDLIRAEYALNEGGRIRVVDGRTLYAAVQTTEKVPHSVSVRARGPGGHASIPLPGNAVARLARAVACIAAHEEPVQLVPTTREFFTRLSTVWPEPEIADAMADVASAEGDRARRACAALCSIPIYNAVLRSGISPTVIAGGQQTNVIPTEAVAYLNVRTLPGDSIDALVERLRTTVNDPAVEITLESRGADAPASDHESPMFDAIVRSVAAIDSRIVSVPYLSTGATESARLRAWGVQTFGLLPFPLAPDDEARMHGHDERVPLASLEFGARVVFDIVRRMTVASA
jgi:acetylornithine deacetylase/succinyl-diaminopimelate desuccinylase-like protein